MAEHVASHASLDPETSTHALSPEVLEELKALGYVEGDASR